MSALPIAFNCIGGRLKARWVLVLCALASLLWVLFFGPFTFPASPLDLLPFPKPQPTPIPAYNRPKPDDVSEPFVPGPPPENWDVAKKQVRDAFKYALDGYLKQAYPSDELRATSGRGKNK
jgi:hypothetical protein